MQKKKIIKVERYQGINIMKTWIVLDNVDIIKGEREKSVKDREVLSEAKKGRGKRTCVSSSHPRTFFVYGSEKHHDRKSRKLSKRLSRPTRASKATFQSNDQTDSSNKSRSTDAPVHNPTRPAIVSESPPIDIEKYNLSRSEYDSGDSTRDESFDKRVSKNMAIALVTEAIASPSPGLHSNKQTRRLNNKIRGEHSREQQQQQAPQKSKKEQTIKKRG